jgi:hypothetical protein
MENTETYMLKRKQSFVDLSTSNKKQKLCSFSTKRKFNDNNNQPHRKKKCQYVEWTNVMRHFQELQYCNTFGYEQYKPISSLPNVLEIYG